MRGNDPTSPDGQRTYHFRVSLPADPKQHYEGEPMALQSQVIDGNKVSSTYLVPGGSISMLASSTDNSTNLLA